MSVFWISAGWLRRNCQPSASSPKKARSALPTRGAASRTSGATEMPASSSARTGRRSPSRRRTPGARSALPRPGTRRRVRRAGSRRCRRACRPSRSRCWPPSGRPRATMRGMNADLGRPEEEADGGDQEDQRVDEQDVRSRRRRGSPARARRGSGRSRSSPACAPSDRRTCRRSAPGQSWAAWRPGRRGRSASGEFGQRVDEDAERHLVQPVAEEADRLGQPEAANRASSASRT